MCTPANAHRKPELHTGKSRERTHFFFGAGGCQGRSVKELKCTAGEERKGTNRRQRRNATEGAKVLKRKGCRAKSMRLGNNWPWSW